MSGEAVIRPTLPADTPALVALAEATGFFKAIEIVALREVLDDYHATCREAGHRCVTLEQNGRPLGFAYYAPAAMTDRTWYLYWIAVEKGQQGAGHGSRLLRHAEEEIRQANGRHLLIETGSVPMYEPTRQFYLRNSYVPVAVVPDYYAVGDSMVVFRRVLGSSATVSTTNA